ncbi:hypothetical protein Pla86_01850 [Planctomycetes bacterium Pla86]|uniref:Uncharacterized protein n=2 Tax=Engelhardtia mirabilis TaxID=2528011 RepID=A0A518BDR1_9BACT|nr:hypothetical protein Pla133_01850 [Planctomycetes bacterium Pla133]QDU99447.1 hypothetical protein Pla86_01850 [Planctomycetes bacterium Pla86]
MLLYEEPYWLWHVTEESSVDWKEIGRFEEALKLHYEAPPNKPMQADGPSGRR